MRENLMNNIKCTKSYIKKAFGLCPIFFDLSAVPRLVEKEGPFI